MDGQDNQNSTKVSEADGEVTAQADTTSAWNNQTALLIDRTTAIKLKKRQKRPGACKNKARDGDTLAKKQRKPQTDSPGVKAASGTGGLEGESSVIFSRMQIVVMGTLLTVYLATLHPSLPGGDAGELIVAASELGVAHPPGYPLYTMLMKAFFLLMPYGMMAWRANLLTAIMAAVAGSVLYQAVFLLSNSVAAGWLAAGLFSFSRLTWIWSVTAEVFALNNLLTALLLVTTIHFSQSESQNITKVCKIGAFVCSLCLSNQHTTVLYIAVITPWVLYVLHLKKVLSLALMVQLSVCFGLGLLPYIYLPLSSMYGQARWTWGNQSTPSGFFTHLFRREYGTMHLLKDHEGRGFVAGLTAYLKHVSKDLTPTVLCLFVTIVFSVYKRWQQRQHEILMVILTMVTIYILFFAWRANLDIEKPLFKSVTERFWLQSDLIVVAVAAVAFCDIMSLINRLVPVLRYHMDKVVAVILVAMQLAMNMAVCDQSGNRTVEEFALSTLRLFPPGALVLTKGDLPSNSLRYFHLVEGVRPDINLFDQEVLTYDWSIPKLGQHVPGMWWPGDRLHLRSGIDSQGLRQFTFQQLLDAHYDRMLIFGCIGVQDHEPSWKASYDLRPFGVCMQFIRKGSSLELSDWLNLTHHFASNWSQPVPLTESTWEDIASAEMWRAMTAAGLYLLEVADSMRNTKEKTRLLRHAYKIYTQAMESHPHFPSYWHKNFAIICEKLRHIADPSETVHLIRTTVNHFKAYLESGTSDSQMGAIKDAIYKLENYLDFVTRSD